MRITRTMIATAAVATGISLIVAMPAGAHNNAPARTPTTKVLTNAVAVPFNLEVSNGKLLVADGAGSVGQVNADGTVSTVVAGVAGASGVAASADGRYLAYTTTTGGGGPNVPITASGLFITGPNGYQAFANTLVFEQANNPDQKVRYGVRNPSQCVVDELAKTPLPVAYTGKVDSHAYSVAAYGNRWVVADAGANALFWVSRSGDVSTLAVLPSQPATITAEAAAGFGLKDCVVGVKYRFEAVPTDVEVGRDGFLYVTTLPGGPEDPSLGARGTVYRVNPWNGRVREVASGLLGATNLAISDGKIYVAELFGGRISLVKHGRVSEYVALPGALSVEAGPKGTLYAGTGVAGAPSVVKITTGKGWKR